MISWIVQITGFFANVLTILASCLAIYIFWTNRGQISQVLKDIASWRVHASVQEVTHKIVKLKEVNIEKSPDEARILLSELIGQLNGVPEFRPELDGLIKKLRRLSTDKIPVNTKKQELLSELTERMKNIQLTMHTKESKK